MKELDRIEDIRSKNNALWVEILRIAMEEAPERTKKVIKLINANDRDISRLLEELSD